MNGKRIAQFRLLEKIGAGATGEVYRAEDVDRGREVAIKVLPAHLLADQDRISRFITKARTATSVTHPNIVTIHEIGEADGQTFIAMELVEGRTLRSLIDKQPLPLKEALRIATEIASGLAAAHKTRIAHRDLKPDNILLTTEGQVKILDFGLARLLDGPLDETSIADAAATDLDCRNDLFSFGCTFYEMLTGKPPIQGTSSALPSSVQRILDKCLAKDPANRYQDTSDLVADLRHIHTDTAPRSTGDRSRIVLGGFVGVVLLMLVLAIAFFRSESGQQDLPVALEETTPVVQENSLAVFAFKNLQNPQDEQRLGQILQELLITDLSGLDPLRVFSSQRLADLQRQLPFNLSSGTPGNADFAHGIAQQAGAQTMLTGTLSQLDNRWILTANLTDVTTGRVLIGKHVEGTDLYSMVDELTHAIQADFKIGRAPEVAARSIRDKTSTSMEAWNHYLDGIEFLDHQEFGEAVVELTRAVEIDPTFGQAYYQLGIATWWQYGDAGSGKEPIQHMLDSRLYASEKERRMAKGMLLVIENKWSEAIPVLKRLTRDYADEKYVWYGLGEAQFHFPGGAHGKESAVSFESAVALDPDFLLPYRHILDVMRQAHNYQGALDRSMQMLQRNPDNTFWLREKVKSLAYTGNQDATKDALDKALAKTSDPIEQRELYMSVFEAVGNLGYLDWAIDVLTKARDVDPNNDVRVQNSYISVLWQQRKYDEVETLLTEWVQREPFNDAARERLFALYMAKGEYRTAHRMALELVEYDADDSRWYRYWSQCAVYSGNDAEVEQALKLAQEHYDSSDDQRNLYSSVAWAYFRTGNPNAAIRYTLLAMDTEPEVDFPDLWSMMGHFELGRERFDAAETWYRKALALRSDDINQLFSLARVSLARGETAIALQHMRNAIERLPDFETKDFIAISALYLNGDVAEADSLLLARRSIHVSEPLRWEGMFNDLESSPPGLAWSYLLRSDTARAKNLFDEAETLDMHKRDPAAYTSRGWSQVLEGDFDKAQQTFAAGLEVGYQHGTLRYGMAAIDYLIGEHDRAEQWVKEAIQEGPVHVRMNRFLARIESARGNWKKAQEYAEISVAMDSTRSSQELLSWVLVSGDLDIDRGIEIAQRAQEMPIRFTDIERRLPFRENADHTLGLAYLKKGATRKALNHLRKALADQPNRQFLQDDLQRALELTADAE